MLVMGVAFSFVWYVCGQFGIPRLWRCLIQKNIQPIEKGSRNTNNIMIRLEYLMSVIRNSHLDLRDEL